MKPRPGGVERVIRIPAFIDTRHAAVAKLHHPGSGGVDPVYPVERSPSHVTHSAKV